LLIYDLQRRSQSKKEFSLVVLDPHGDLAKKVLSFAHNTQKERVIYVSSSINREGNTKQTYSAIINPFDNDGSDEEINILSQELADALMELLSDSTYNFTPQMQAIIRPCIATVLRTKNPCLNELKRFMLDGQNEDLIELGKQSPNAQHRDFFNNDFHIDEYRITKKSIRTKLTYFLGDQTLSNMINGKSTIDLEKCMNEGKIIIFNLPKGSGKFTSSVFGRLMIAYIHSIVLRRDNLPENKRKQCFMIIDEFQNYLTSSLASNMTEARKYGLSMILATQSLRQIDSANIRKSVIINTGIKCVSQTDYEDRSTFAKELGINVKELEDMKPLQFVVKREDGEHTPFKVQVPILSSKYYLLAEQRKELMNYLLYKSGIYKEIIDTDLHQPKPNEYKPKEAKPKQRTKNDNPFDDNLKPKF
jgi:hypothetical protein